MTALARQRERTASRLAVCAACPLFVGKRPLEKCTACGCYARARAMIPMATCPEKRWP